MGKSTKKRFREVPRGGWRDLTHNLRRTYIDGIKNLPEGLVMFLSDAPSSATPRKPRAETLELRDTQYGRVGSTLGDIGVMSTIVGGCYVFVAGLGYREIYGR